METIKSSKEIDLIFKNGEKINLPFLSLYFYKSENIKGEVAFIAGKKNGNAV
ncbi:MAG: ribonuclease P protein component [Coriobacteriia bacterium]|nr:ribonuclease P protein component [Coriobacteriia bacterium]